MAKCDYPQKVLDKGTRSKTGKIYNEDVVVPCGKCYNCRMRRIRSWIFRLKKEYEVSKSAYFVTLTYDTKNVPLTKNKFMTLSVAKVSNELNKKGKFKTVSSDPQLFFKQLRKIEPDIKYYLAGEYGGRTKRPHYHLILFNVKNIENVHKTWTKGDVHHGNVTQASIAYSLEYITKQSDVPEHKNDDREKEFSLFSKGLGKSYLSDEVLRYHKQNWQNMYITIEDGTKIPMPKYYRDKIFTDKEKAKQALHIQEEVKKIEEKEEKEKGFRQIEAERIARVKKLNNKKTKKD